MLRVFYVSMAVSVLGMAGAAYYAGWSGLFIAFILSLMEISLSFDNAVVNASVLKDMEEKWRRRFLTWGILIAVFGMRLIFPILMVAVITQLNSVEVLELAINNPDQYAVYLHNAHHSISSFGGMFLLMVFLGFLFDSKRKVHWLGVVEEKFSWIGNLESIEIIAALLILVTLQSFVAPEEQNTVLVSGIVGLSVYVIIHSLSTFMNKFYMVAGSAVRNGFASFIYLEVLDASFSFDGVIGAFALTKDIFIITIGLGVGAFFVRSLTILMVERKTLQNYIYLEHGAHYALGALATLMLVGIFYDVPEVVIGGVGFIVILLSFISSVRYARRQRNKRIMN